MGSSIWYWLRLSRSGPFGEARGDEERARVYRAAMQQFEELMKAAAATGPSGRPLPLFYGLSQAGRAIVAARGGPLHTGHGITIDEPAAEILKTSVRPVKRREIGQFQAVAQAVESPEFNAPVELGAFMASLPELSDELLVETDWPRALQVWPDVEQDYYPRHPEWLPIRIIFDDDVKTAENVAHVLAHYPAAQDRAGSSPVDALLSAELYRTPTPGGLGTRVMWRDDGAGIDRAIPEYRYRGRRWLRPAVVGVKEPPSPLMTWWALLFGLSMLARYHPVPWVEALDPDSSSIAVSLERAMAEALDALPHLVFEALLGQPLVVPASWI